MINNKISNHDYHKAKGISKTGLDLINQNPAIYKYACENKREIVKISGKYHQLCRRLLTLDHLLIH